LRVLNASNNPRIELAPTIAAKRQELAA
jgi:hypothetical protein